MNRNEETDKNEEDDLKHNDNTSWSTIDDLSILKDLDEPFDLENGPNCSRLRSDENYDGFDNNLGPTWIYPINKPIRTYQLSISKAALYRNSLVVLPTGLGKTFIAAVVMYNVYRWYPRGKLIFMAPTRPLVTQQIEACCKIMGMHKSDIAEMTGRTNKKSRREIWQSKRLFFATPQVVQLDLVDPEVNFPFKDIKLIVIDEAHKAKGRYAYVEVVQCISERNRNFRVLALSATPGRNIGDVIEVVRNLLISHIEIRYENSIDVAPFTHKKNIKTIVVSLSEELTSIRDQLQDLIDPYLKALIDEEVISGNATNMSKGWLLMEQKRFRERSLRQRHISHSKVCTNFSICISLYHSLELLERHGIRVLINYFDDNRTETEKFFVNYDYKIKQFVENLRKRAGLNHSDLNDKSTLNGEVQNMLDDSDFGHPKYEKTREILLEHFDNKADSRAIIFCEFRESVMLMNRMLLQNRPKINPRCFVGQGGLGSIRAVTQAQQMKIMKDFRGGVCNTLIATSVAEEGIDVGEVDLIICFDISTKNPTRFVQRIGRTGRMRHGQVILLATEGKEHSTIKEVLASKDKTNLKLMKCREIKEILYKWSPRLVPPEFDPKCLEVFMKEEEESENEENPSDSKKPKNKTSKKEKISKPVAQKSNSQSNNMRKYLKKVEPEFQNNLQISTSSKDYEDNVEDLLRSKNVAKDVKKNLLLKNVSFVKEKYEAMKTLWSADYINLDDISENDEKLRATYKLIEKVLGDRTQIERFLKDFADKDKTFSNDFNSEFTNDVSNTFQEDSLTPDDTKKIESLNNILPNEDFHEILDFADNSDAGTSNSINQTSLAEEEITFADYAMEELDTSEVESKYANQFTQFQRANTFNQSTPKQDKMVPEIGNFKRKNQSKSDAQKHMRQTKLSFESSIVSKNLNLSNRNNELSKTKLSKCLSNIFDEPDIFASQEMAEIEIPKQSNEYQISVDMFDDDFDQVLIEGENIIKAKLSEKVEPKERSSIKSTLSSNAEDLNETMTQSRLQNNQDDSEQTFGSVEAKSFANQTLNMDQQERLERCEDSNTQKIEPTLNHSMLTITQILKEVDRPDRITHPEIENFDLNDFEEPFEEERMGASSPELLHSISFEKSMPDEKTLEEFNHMISAKSMNASKNLDDYKAGSPSMFTQSEIFQTCNDTSFKEEKESQIFVSPQNPSHKAVKDTVEVSPLLLRPSGNFGIRKFNTELISSSMNKNNLPVNCSLPNDRNKTLDESTIIKPLRCKKRFISSSESESDGNASNTSYLDKNETVVTPNSILRTESELRKRKRIRIERRQSAKRCAFLDDQAEHSGSSDENESELTNLNEFYDSIVVEDNDAENLMDSRIYGKYIETTKSPLRARGGFKIPAPRKFMDMSRIFSQAVEDDQESYSGSFIASQEEIEPNQLNSGDEMSPLSKAEAILKQRKRDRRKGISTLPSRPNKRRRILNDILENSDDEDS